MPTAPNEHTPLPPAVAISQLATEYLALLHEAAKTYHRDPWLRWLRAPPFEAVCIAIEYNPEDFLESLQALKQRG